MPLELRVQLNIIIYSLLAGLLTGTFFDAYRVIRGTNINKIVKWIEDLLFWVLCAVIIFTFLLYFNYAFLGIYVYMFMFLSLLIYFKLVSIFTRPTILSGIILNIMMIDATFVLFVIFIQKAFSNKAALFSIFVSICSFVDVAFLFIYGSFHLWWSWPILKTWNSHRHITWWWDEMDMGAEKRLYYFIFITSNLISIERVLVIYNTLRNYMSQFLKP